MVKRRINKTNIQPEDVTLLDLCFAFNRLPVDIEFRIVPLSGNKRVKVKLRHKYLTILNRINPKIESGEQGYVEKGKHKTVRWKRLIGGQWQLEGDRQAGNGIAYDTKERAIAVLIMKLLKEKFKNRARSNG